MFEEQLFSAFEDQTVQGRLARIRQRVDPFFEDVASGVLPILNEEARGYKAFIAKHARRHLNPPPNTWIAFGQNTRGYKMIPHYEVGLWDDRLFIWLACEVNIKERQPVVLKLQTKQADFLKLDSSFQLSTNHMAKPVQALTKEPLIQAVTAYQTQKSREVLIGKTFDRQSLRSSDEDELLATIQTTIQELSQIWDK
ncbi:DUF1054 family protein [Pediococcus siamensis]|uniref:DUF1054 family protein n=1 Tax=Pediococcus siamensis TaxID=381829 RepID=UPI0039A13F35